MRDSAIYSTLLTERLHSANDRTHAASPNLTHRHDTIQSGINQSRVTLKREMQHTLILPLLAS